MRALFVVLLVLVCGAAALLYFGDFARVGVEPVTQAPAPDGKAAPMQAAAHTAKGNEKGPGESREAVTGEQPAAADQPLVRGRVVLASGVPVADVPVAFRTIPEDPFMRRRPETLPSVAGRTDGAGRFALRVAAGTKGFFAVTGDDYVLGVARQPAMLGERDAIDVGPDGVDLGDRVVVGAARVTGQVIAGGRGVEGVEIVFGSKASLNARTRATTDADGRFELTGMHPGKVTIATRSPRYLPADKSLELVEGERREGVVLELRPGGFVSGTVVDDRDTPIAGVQVSAARESQPRSGVQFTGFRSGESTETDAAGRFHLAGLERETARLRASKDGYVAGEVTDVKVGTDGVVLRVQRHARVEGVLVDEAGKPIAGSAVRARPAERSPGFLLDDLREPVRTDAEGRFALDSVVPGATEIVATGTGHLPARERIEIAPGGKRDDLRLSARRGTTLTVRVVDHKGAPVANAKVSILEPAQPVPGLLAGHGGNRAFRRTIRRERSAGRTVERMLGVDPETLGSGETDASGVLVVAGLPAGKVEVRARHKELAMTAPAQLELPDSGDARCEVGMQRGGFVRFTVVDATGKPIPDAKVEVTGPIEGAVAEAGKATHDLDRDGLAVVGPLRPGAYRAVLEMKARPLNLGTGMSFAVMGDTKTLQDSAQSFDIKPDGTVAIKLTRPVLTEVRGIVRDAEGVVAGAEVELVGEGEVRMPIGGSNKTSTDAEGRFSLPDLTSGKYTLYWNRKGGAVPSEKSVVFAANQALHEETLQIPGGRIELRAVDRSGGFGIGEARVSLSKAQAPGAVPQAPRRRVMMVSMSSTGGPGSTSTIRMNDGENRVETDAKGNAVLRDIPAGDYTLTISHGDYAKVTQSVSIGGDTTKKLGEIRMTEGCRIRGRVNWTDPTGLALALVEITDAQGGNRDTKMARNGSFLFDGLASGTYKLRAQAVSGDDWGPVQTVEVRPGRGESVTLEIPAPKK